VLLIKNVSLAYNNGEVEEEKPKAGHRKGKG